MNPAYSIVTGPVAEPVDLASVQAQVRQDSNADDTLLTRLISVVRDAYEGEHGLYFISQTVDMYLPCFPCEDYLRITRGPVQSVTSVKYILSDGTEQTFAPTEYDVDTRRNRIVLKFGKSWPAATLRPMDPVIVRMVMGWADAASVPPKAKHAMLMDIDHLYNHRGNVEMSNIAVEAKEIARASRWLMADLRNWAV